MQYPKLVGDNCFSQPSFILHLRKRIQIPKTLKEAVEELDKILSPEFKLQLKRCPVDNLVGYHFGLGAWIRQNWGFWVNSQLAQDLIQTHPEAGCHPDDLSRFVIRAYWKHLTDVEVLKARD